MDLYALLRPWVRLLNDRPYGRVVAAILAKVEPFVRGIVDTVVYGLNSAGAFCP